MGSNAPGPTGSQCAKPRPRAVIESCGKSCEDAAAKSILAAELCHTTPALPPPRIFRTAFHLPALLFSSAARPTRDARAPPMPTG